MVTLSIFSFFNTWLIEFINTPGHSLYVYLLLGAIIFVETGLVIMPFLPGDSILFFVGSLVALHPDKLSLIGLIVSMSILAILANILNYHIGKWLGDWLLGHGFFSKLIKPSHIEESHAFFEKHGAVALFFGRFMPIIRTFVPFTAGTSHMPYRKFLFFNVISGVTWVSVALIAGYCFGEVPFIKAHFELVMLMIIVISLLPVVITGIRGMQAKKN